MRFYKHIISGLGRRLEGVHGSFGGLGTHAGWLTITCDFTSGDPKLSSGLHRNTHTETHVNKNKPLKTYTNGAVKMAQPLRASAALAEDSGVVPAHRCWLTTVNNPSYGDLAPSSGFCGHSLHMVELYTHTGKHSYT